MCAHSNHPSGDDTFLPKSIQVAAPMYSDPHYADSAYAIIGRALEYVTGVKYEEYVTKGILEPLGTMLNSHQQHLNSLRSKWFNCVCVCGFSWWSGMTDTFFEYVASSELGKRVPPGKAGSLPSFVAHTDLYWARPTGQVSLTIVIIFFPQRCDL